MTKKQTRSAQRPKKKITKTVKAWAVVDYKGDIPETFGRQIWMYTKKERAIKMKPALHRVVPCTITYNIPTPKTEIVRGYNAIADVPPPPHPNEC